MNTDPLRVIVVGGGKIGAALAELVLERGHDVTIVEMDHGRAAALGRLVTGARIVTGDGCEPAVLEFAGIERADSVAAVTGDDEDNLVVCLLARRHYGVETTAARVNDPRNEWLFTERFGVDHALSGTRRLAKLVMREIEAG